MNQKIYNVLGVMSGTSLDGVDIAYIQFEENNNNWKYKIIHSTTTPYNNEWVQKLKNAIHLDNKNIISLNIDYTQLLATYINDFIKTHQLKNIDFISSHGHTIFHKPHLKYTLQIGNLPEIANLTQNKVVCDFRIEDVLLGGQGAPLVPIGDKLLFNQYDYCLNLGGFSNISFDENNKRIAFDISPVNTVLNHLANQIKLEYDPAGINARNGKLNNNLFEELNQIPFYLSTYPKSLGIEFVNSIILPLLEKYTIPIFDLLNTFTEHIAYQIGRVLKNESKSILITGGGAYNQFLIDRIKYYSPNTQIIIPDAATLEFKEALIFAFLGLLKTRNEINVLASVTGAPYNHSSGKIYYPTI